jgi:hypothetical protein
MQSAVNIGRASGNKKGGKRTVGWSAPAPACCKFREPRVWAPTCDGYGEQALPPFVPRAVDVHNLGGDVQSKSRHSNSSNKPDLVGLCQRIAVLVSDTCICCLHDWTLLKINFQHNFGSKQMNLDGARLPTALIYPAEEEVDRQSLKSED